MTGINLDALLAESEPKPLTYKGKEFTLPAELPGSTIAPFLSEDLGVVELFSNALADAEDDDNVIDLVLAALKKQPRLPLALLSAAKVAFADLLGEQYDEFMALKPSVPAWFLLAREVATTYGMGLADFFLSSESSETDGTDSKPTSNTTTGSTPEVSGESQEPTAS